MALTANQARSLATDARTANIEEVYTEIEAQAKLGNSMVLLGEKLNYDIVAELATQGFTVTNPTPSSTQISWASVTA